MCSSYEWRSALEDVVLAVNRDKKNFASLYMKTAQNGFTPPESLVINFVVGGDPSARERIERMIPSGAPVEWRTVKYSWNDLSRVMTSDKFLSTIETVGVISMYGIDVISDSVQVTTVGSQPELVAQLTDDFPDMVTVVASEAVPTF